MTVPESCGRPAALRRHVRTVALLVAPVVMAFVVPPVGFLFSLSLPVLVGNVRSRVWPHTSAAAAQVWSALALFGLWSPAVLALTSDGRIGFESNAWLLIPLCAPSGAALVVPAVTATAVYLCGLTVSLARHRPWPWMLGTWGSAVAYWLAAGWLVDFSCVA